MLSYIIRTTDDIEHAGTALRQLERVFVIKLICCLHYVELDEGKRCSLVVIEAELDAVDELTLQGAEHGLEVDGPEVYARNVALYKVIPELIGICNPLCRKYLERKGVANAYAEIICSIEFTAYA